MILEAATRSCFSNEYVLYLDGAPVGRWRRRFFSERIDVERRGAADLAFVRDGFFGGRMVLHDDRGRVVGEAARGGFLSAAWDLLLTGGDARLESAGWFNTGFDIRKEGRIVGHVDRTGICSGGWRVDGDDDLAPEDLILVGLLYSTILRRRSSSSSST